MSNDHHHPHHSEKPASGYPRHKKWVVIVGVSLMLLAMLTYVLTMDEALEPGAPQSGSAPIAAP